MELFVAVSVDRLTRFFGYENGAGHGLMIPADGFGNPLAVSDGSTVCGKTLDTARLSEKFQGDRMCKACAKRITGEMVESAYAVSVTDSETETDAGELSPVDMVSDAVTETMEEVGGEIRDAVGTAVQEPVAPVSLTPEEAAKIVEHVAKYGKSPEVLRVEKAEEERESGTGVPVQDGDGPAFVMVDGKCAREVTDREGNISLKPVNGRAKVSPVDGSMAVNRDGAAVGVCPQCRREVTLTDSGHLGTHYPVKVEMVTGDAKPLTEQSVTDLVASAAEKRVASDIAAERKAATEGERKVTADDVETSQVGRTRANRAGKRRAAKMPEARDSRPVRSGMPGAKGDQRGEGSRGAALVPGGNAQTFAGPVTVRSVGEAGPETDPSAVVGESSRGHAATFDGGIGTDRPDRGAVEGIAEMHGGRYGWLTTAEYMQLTPSKQRNYWRKIAKKRQGSKEARAIEVAKRVALGEMISAEEMRDLRKGARVGSSAAGHLSQGFLKPGHGATAEESQKDAA
ncbi:hypothetical protein ABT282_07475 [Streptomyces sp. NPDC000927]|uniref:hypothetical protein n=1 Tax=Streptomyces sp. NPDC000927 TaxID=3154371 RepID=UPI0033332767